MLNLLGFIKKYKHLFFVLGLLITIIVGAKDVNYWGLKEKSGEQLLNEINIGLSISQDIELSEKQFHEIESVILKNPNKYSNQQKALISDKSGKQILQEVTKENISNVILNYKQFQEILNLIAKNPNNYSSIQKTLIKEKSVEEILRLVGYGIRHPSSFTLTENQYQEIKVLLLSNPKGYSATQKLLIPEMFLETNDSKSK